MTLLADLIDRVQQMCLNELTSDYTDAQVTEAINQALDEYNISLPFQSEAPITLDAAGREIPLDDDGIIPGLLEVTQVWWPYDSSVEIWPPNRVRGYTVFLNAEGVKTLFLNTIDGTQPQAGDTIRVWYTVPNTIEGLAEASATTIPASHYGLIVLGAAGNVVMNRVVYLTEAQGTDMFATGLLGSWGARQVKEFRSQLTALRKASARSGLPYGQGWSLDKWDQGN